MHQFLAFFLLLNLMSFSYVCASAVDQASTLATSGQFVDAASLSCRSDLDTLLPDELKLVGVDFQVDGACDDAELKYLTGLKVGQMVKRTDVSNALFYLQHMQRFSLIQLEIISDRLGYRLIFHLTKSPILHRVVVTGFLRGKESLKNVYLIDIGEQFEQQKHHHSIEQIVNFLRDKGYFQARVEDTVTIHPVTKEVVVRCRVKKGSKFQVRNVQVVFDHVGTVAGEEVATLQQGIERLCDSKIKGKFYSFELVETLRQKIKKLLERHGCIDFEIQVLQDLVVDHKNVDLAVHINLERKREFVFWGATFFTSEQLIDHLLLYGKSTWHFPSSLIVDEIEQLYKNKGFWDVHVSVREEKERVFCFIQEGLRTKISSVRFVNNHHVFDVALLKSAFYYLLKSKTFDQDLFKKSCENVLKIYKQLGFWDVKIVKYDFVAGKKEHTQDLVIVLDEGSKKTLGNISIPGQTEMERQLLMLWGKQVGKGFDFSLLQEQKQWMLRYLKNKGYQKVLINYALHDDQGIVSVVWNVTLAESAVKMGKAIIVGNCKIAHNMLMKEVVHEYGDDWDKQKIETTLQNLRGLSIFDSVQVFPCSDLDENLCKPVYIKLLESDRYEVKTRFGMQQIGKNLQFRRGFTYLFGGTLCIKNPFYRADQFLLEADVTRFYRNVGASYDSAWLADYKIRCQLKLYDALYQQPVYIGSQNFLYKGTQQGFLWNMTHTRLTKKHSQCTLSGSAGVEFVGIFQADQPHLNTIIDYDKALLGKKTAYVFVEPTFLWQRVDTLLNPHRGHIFFMSCKGMFDLDSKTSFFKCLVEHTQYFPIAERATLALRGRAGHIFNRCFQQINPMERFYLGGSNSVRGYERDYCPPFGKLTCPIYDQHAGLPPAACNYWRYAPQGGRTMFNINAELRYNLYKNLGLVFFNDMGALFKHSIYDELKTGPDNFFGGSGFGIRYDTPIGPLRFDVGFKWKIGHPDFQSRHVLYLTIGQAF